tara:strand:- start:530 stop:838 length:309 start_codon:yes stop_codon:yes gene_type:complete
MSASKFNAVFNTKATAQVSDQGYFRKNIADDASPISYVVLTEETTFDFIAKAYTAQAGDVLFENTNDEDGYTVVPAGYFDKNFIPAPPSGTAVKQASTLTIR